MHTVIIHELMAFRLIFHLFSGADLTADEQLVFFRNQSFLRQHSLRKTVKYGFKMLSCDTVTSEHLKRKLDPGKQPTSHTQNNQYVYILMEI